MSMLTTKDLQKLLHVDRSTIYRMAEAGRLPAIKVGRQWRFPTDRINRWLEEHNMAPAPRPVAEVDLKGDSLDTLLPPEYVTSIGTLFGETLGVMVVVTDMDGNPLAEPSNQCGLFKLVNEQPGAVQKCVDGWRELAHDLDLAPRFAPSHLGLLCARSYLRVGSELRGIILVGGIAPDRWPPSEEQIAVMSEEFGIGRDRLLQHINDVFRLDDTDREKVLALLPRLARFISEVSNERKRLFSKLDAIAELAGTQ